MSMACEICGKKRQLGYSISHAHNKKRKIWLPNLQKVKAILPSGDVKRIRVCTSCLRSNKVQKATV